MKATEILMHEHQVILVVLEALEGIVADANENGRLNRQAASEAIDFFRNFADHCHHAKEENQLFPVLTEKGVPNESGPIGVMLNDHDVGRAHVRSMANAIDMAADGGERALKTFTANAHNYVTLLRSHIFKEDNVLFRMADQVLDEADDKELLSRYERVEREHIGEGVHEKYLAIAKKLSESFVKQDQIDHTLFQSDHSSSCSHQ